MAKKLKRPSAKTYNRRAAEVAFDHAPEIYPCNGCGNPVATGYCCTFCGDDNPSEARGRKK